MSKKQCNKKLKSIILLSTFVILIISISYYYIQKYRKSNTFSENSKYQVKGIDVSHHNPILNWEEVRNQNISFAYIKATEGITHDDRNYIYNYDLAKQNNIKVGSYHFYSFATSGRDQAKHFIDIAKCKQGDLIPAIDVEHSLNNPYSKDSAFVQNVIKELKILENELYNFYGIHPLIYTNGDCYKLYIKNNFPRNPLWISSLVNEPTNGMENWVIWQFTHTGKLPGIVGDIDFNYFRHSYDQLNEISLP